MLVIDLLVAFVRRIIASLGIAALSQILVEKQYLRRKRGALRTVSDGSSGSVAYVN